MQRYGCVAFTHCFIGFGLISYVVIATSGLLP